MIMDCLRTNFWADLFKIIALISPIRSLSVKSFKEDISDSSNGIGLVITINIFF